MWQFWPCHQLFFGLTIFCFGFFSCKMGIVCEVVVRTDGEHAWLVFSTDWHTVSAWLHQAILLLGVILSSSRAVVEIIAPVQRARNYQLCKGFIFGFFIWTYVWLWGAHLLGNKARYTCLGLELQATFCLVILIYPCLLYFRKTYASGSLTSLSFAGGILVRWEARVNYEGLNREEKDVCGSSMIPWLQDPSALELLGRATPMVMLIPYHFIKKMGWSSSIWCLRMLMN